MQAALRVHVASATTAKCYPTSATRCISRRSATGHASWGPADRGLQSAANDVQVGRISGIRISFCVLLCGAVWT